MNGDGDILGTRRHLEVQPSNSASLGITSTVGGKNEPNPAAAGSGSKAGAGAVARSTTGHSSVLNSLKRQRSVGGIAAGIGKSGAGENEVHDHLNVAIWKYFSYGPKYTATDARIKQTLRIRSSLWVPTLQYVIDAN